MSVQTITSMKGECKITAMGVKEDQQNEELYERLN